MANRRHQVVETTLATAVANAGTVTLAYPAGTVQADYIGANAATGHTATVAGNNRYTGALIAVAFGASNITLTNNSGETWPAGASLIAGLEQSDTVTALTDNSGGAASDTIAVIGATYVQAEVRNAVASLAAKVNALQRQLDSAGII
ncbi:MULTISPECIES: hypothetical protein [unclassified Aurantimonas]|uniref:hypothetical protein n=1 Tax=unclassified Aurantimonas TaxID=2638230 RepID=UPI002E18F90F|nr:MULTISPECIES: hypothetical protein [unclassified Aurantimonas]MEC5291586.1 hypothetical protein [Aurantimonas sp. C2-3-R2]MEC5412670.1 hypothetical protein [Aurantimonas sp. C2-4-R8]